MQRKRGCQPETKTLICNLTLIQRKKRHAITVPSLLPSQTKKAKFSECSRHSFFGSLKKKTFLPFSSSFPAISFFMSTILKLLPFSSQLSLSSTNMPCNITICRVRPSPENPSSSKVENTDYVYDFPCQKNIFVKRRKREQNFW